MRKVATMANNAPPSVSSKLSHYEDKQANTAGRSASSKSENVKFMATVYFSAFCPRFVEK
jgi:hypothetical protein